MCGIAGILNFNNSAPDPALIRAMNHCMQHRGPDAEAFYESGPIALGHRRLSIIDLSESANQPMADASGRYWLVFNGEIYNFMEVKAKLPNYPYRTHGDSEVILAAYAAWGVDCLQHFAGMFALAIWDTQEQSLFIARDRLGVKPLYYFHKHDHFAFASEMRSLLSTGMIPRKASREAISQFLQFQSVAAPLSMIENVIQLEAGAYLVVKDNSVEQHFYWKTSDHKEVVAQGDRKTVTTKIRELLTRSIERRLISDVPLGAFLSGGIDSSIVVGLMATVQSEPVNTFTMSFEEKAYDESPYADIISKKFRTRHTNVKVKPSLFLDELQSALNAMDSPSGDGINSYVVSKKIRQSGITVALSGIGGDELFAGYPIFKQFLQLQKLAKVWRIARPARNLLAGVYGSRKSANPRLQQLMRIKSPAISDAYPIFRQVVSPGEIETITKLSPAVPSLIRDTKDWNTFPMLSQVTMAELNGYTQHTLLKDTDQMSMAASLEVREPFFDHDLVEYVLNIPDSIKFPSTPKQLLVDSVADLLPPEIVHRKKQGFLMPWEVWMKNELKPFAEGLIRRIGQRDFINQDALESKWNSFLAGNPNERFLELWLFVVLEYWLEKNNVE